MKNATTSYPGIKRIGYLPTSKLSPQLMLKSIAGMPIAVLSDITFVSFYGEPICETSNSYKEGGRLEEVTLSFSTSVDIPTDVALAFVAETIAGKKFLIGTLEKPYPVVTITRTTGSSSKSATTSVEITHQTQKSLLEVSV